MVWNLLRCIAVLSLAWLSNSVGADEDIRIAVIEPYTGPSAGVGKWFTDHVRMAVDRLNASGGLLGGRHVRIETFDSKSNPQEAIVALNSISDKGIGFVFGTTGSNIAIALNEAITKHNARDPSSPILFLNHGALASELTNESCSYWHFRFGANSDMQVMGVIRYIAQQKEIKSVYLLNQDYAYGQAVQRLMRELLAQQRPDIKLVGDELVPLQKTKDFAPYVSKIRSSGSNAVLTSFWGQDLNLLMKAAHDFGMSSRFFTVHAHLFGGPAAIGETGAGRLVNLATWHANVANTPLADYASDFRKQYKEDWNYLPAKAAVEMWARAVSAAASTDTIKVAKALEGSRYDAGTGQLWMRPDDHQLSMPLFLGTFMKVGPGVQNPAEDTGFGFRTEARLEAEATTLPTRCKMERP